MYEEVMKKQPESNIDRYFGIVLDEEGGYIMGNKTVQVVGNDIVVDGDTYKGTPGLWSLIFRKIPKGFTPEDMKEYKKLVSQTNVMTHPQNQTRRSRPKQTWKWKHIFKNMEEEGHGIKFLPSDIISLQQLICLLNTELVTHLLLEIKLLLLQTIY